MEKLNVPIKVLPQETLAFTIYHNSGNLVVFLVSHKNKAVQQVYSTPPEVTTIK